MKLVAYVRVSTAGQVSDGYGLGVQEKAVKTWAKNGGHRIVRPVSYTHLTLPTILLV